MNLLVVAQRYYPDTIRINEITYDMVKRGHQVTVLTSLPDYITGTIPKEYRWGRKRKETVNGVQVIRVPVIARRTGMVFRALNYFSFLLTSTFRASWMKKKFDVIFCYNVSPITTAHAAVKMKQWTKKKFLLYCLDLWPESLKAWDVKENSFLFRFMLKYSRWIYQNCDNIAISSLPFREYLMEVDDVDRDKILYLPQHADEIETEASNVSAQPSKEVNLAFAGNIGRVQDVQCIIRAVSRLRDVPPFTVHIYGNGSALSECRTLADELGVAGRVQFYGRMDREALLQEYQKMDAFLLTLKDEGYIGKTMPAKLQEYMSFGKPVIAAIGGAAQQVIREANCGLLSPPSDDATLAKCIEAFVRCKEQYVPLGKNGYDYFRKNFTLDVFMERFEKILSDMQ